MNNIKTIKCSITNTKADDEIYSKAGEIIRSGGLVAFPTETVYGLGGDAFDAEASVKIYQAKGRPSDNPLIVHICKTEDLYKVASYVDDRALSLAEAFWPGPLTMILPKSRELPLETTGGLDTVAIRCPSHRVANEFIKVSERFIAAPSANISGRPSPTKAEHVIEDLDGRIDMIIDGGTSDIGLESTIVDLSGKQAMILRPGYITKTMLESVIGVVDIDPGIMIRDSNIRPKAPGMRYRHYAPKAPLTIVSGMEDMVVGYISAACDKTRKEGKKVGIIATASSINRYDADVIECIGDRTDEQGIASHLYDVLRYFDKTDVDIIYSESFDDHNLGQAIMNRLLKAAGHNMIELNERKLL